MAVIVYVVGNDGSGKSTFARRLQARLEARGVRVHRMHYYSHLVRRLLRIVIEGISSPSAAKLEAGGDSGQAAPARKRGGGTRGGLRGVLQRMILPALFLYETALALEARLRGLARGPGVVIVDRSFVDDLVSISASLHVDLSPTLVGYAASLHPLRRLFYLTAGHECEYGRVVDVDLSKDFHLKKHHLYERAAEILETGGARLHRVSTRPRRRADEPAPAPRLEPGHQPR